MPRKKYVTGNRHISMPRVRENSRCMQTHETVVDLISGRANGKTLQDAFPFGIFAVRFTRNTARTLTTELCKSANGYALITLMASIDFASAFMRHFDYDLEDDIMYSDGEEDDYAAVETLHPHPRIRQLTPEEEEKHAKELLEEEERQKDRAEKKKLKRLRKKERKLLVKDNATKDKDSPDEEPEEFKSSENQEENIAESSHKVEESTVPGPGAVLNETGATSLEESSGSNDYSDDVEVNKDGDRKPQDLDMNSPLVSTAASITVKQVDLNQNNKAEKKGKSKKLSVQPEEKRPQVLEEKTEVVGKQPEGNGIMKEVMEPVKSISSENQGENIFESSEEAKESDVPGPGPFQNETGATALEESRGTYNDDNDNDDEEELNKELDRELQDLDMSSSFVSSAASIAKRQLDQNHTPQRRGKKKKSLLAVQQPKEKRIVIEDRPEVQEKRQEADDIIQEKKEDVDDLAIKSTELANIGNKFAACGQLEEAVRYFSDAIQYNPKEFKLFGNRSFCYERMQEYERALTDAEVALSMEPKWRKGLFRKGKALYGLKRYYDASLIYEEVLRQDSSCTEAAQELRRVQAMQLMEMGFTGEQSLNAITNHATFEEALEALFGFEVSLDACASNHNTNQPTEKEDEDWITASSQRRKVPSVMDQTRPKSQLPTPLPRNGARPELFPVWVGSVVSTITEAKLNGLFNRVGNVYSIKMLLDQQCAFVHYTNKDDCEKAIQLFNGMAFEGVLLSVRYPNKIHLELGVSRLAVTEPIPRPPTSLSSVGGRFGQIHW